jgi:hypothetical protein
MKLIGGSEHEEKYKKRAPLGIFATEYLQKKGEATGASPSL